MSELTTSADATTPAEDPKRDEIDMITGRPVKTKDDRKPDEVRRDDHDEVSKDLANALSAGKKLHAIASGDPITDETRLTADEEAALGVLGAHAFPTSFGDYISGYGMSLKNDTVDDVSGATVSGRNYIGPMRRALAHAIRNLEAKQ